MRGAVARLESVEFRRMGERGVKGRYPLHFHRAGGASASCVRACGIHHCCNRSLTIHGTRRLRVSDTVSFDTIGHAFFLEDGDETKNVLSRNLVFLTRAAAPGANILLSDLTPATFWVTNPDNVLAQNVAAGSEHNGFGYSPPKHPREPWALMLRSSLFGRPGVSTASASCPIGADGIRNIRETWTLSPYTRRKRRASAARASSPASPKSAA